MSSNYYDVVVMGLDLGPLCAGALLAKRGFRVLVVGERDSFDTYSCSGYTFRKRPFVFSGSSSPAVSRVVSALSMGQLLNHVKVTPGLAYQVVMPNHRIDVFTDPARTRNELVREFPQVKSRIDGLFREVGRYSGEFEKIAAHDLVIPPESFFERRVFARLEVQNPFYFLPETNLWDRLNVDGPLRDFFCAPTFGELGNTGAVSPLVAARQAGAWLFDLRQIKGGKDGVRKLLTDRIVGNGGDVQRGDRVDKIAVRRGRVTGVYLEGQRELIATRVVLTEHSPAALKRFVAPDNWTKRFIELLAADETKLRGYSVNLGVKRNVLPMGLAHTVLCAPHRDNEQGWMRVEQIPQADSDRVGLLATQVVSARQGGQIESGELRDRILDRMRRLFPFLDNYLEVIHSPYDQFGAVVVSKELEGPQLGPIHPDAVPVWRVRQPGQGGALGMENLPHRCGIKGLLGAGGQVVAGLSLEGEFMAAWGAARIAEGMGRWFGGFTF